MPSYKAKGLVIKSYRLGETDKIIRLFTPDNGLISAVAKGAFNIKSRFSGRLELYNIIDGEFSQGKSLDILSQAEVLETFDNISNDFLKFNYLQIISELILKTQTEKAASYNLFKLTYLTIKKINDIEQQNKLLLQLNIVFYMINFLKITGHAPMLDSCTVCGKDFFGEINKTVDTLGQRSRSEHLTVSANKDYIRSTYFSINFGGFVCKDCSVGLTNLRFLNKKKINVLKELFNCKLEDLKTLSGSIEVADLLDLMLQYISFHFDITLSSFAYLKKIQKKLI